MSFKGPDCKYPCPRCGKRISNRGLAQHSHLAWHTRIDAKAVEIAAAILAHSCVLAGPPEAPARAGGEG